MRSITQAIIMAGGKGTRLYPYSAVLPKTLMPVGDVPLIELLIMRLKRAGVKEIIIAVNHLRHLIEAFAGDGSRFGVRIIYSVEDEPLGTGGAIQNLLPNLGDDFIVINGDLFTSLDFTHIVNDHFERISDVTIAVREVTTRLEWGVATVDDDMNLCALVEKPTSQHLVMMGLYILKKRVLENYLPDAGYLDMPDLLGGLAGSGAKVRCCQRECIWLDIGRPDDLAAAQRMVEELPEVFAV